MHLSTIPLAGLSKYILHIPNYCRRKLRRSLWRCVSNNQSVLGLTALQRKNMSVPTGKPGSIDKHKFKRILNLWAVKINAKLTKLFMTSLSQFMFRIPRFKSVYNVPNECDQRYMLLAESLSAIEDKNSLPSAVIELCITHSALIERYQLTMGYEHLSVDDVLRQILPTGTEIPSSFEQIGHIAHMNLRESVLEYRYIIGTVILDKNPTLRTVVNKIGTIETEFRTFPMEVLAGVDEMDVTVRESGSRFTFNFADVYWNSRLSTEHQRLVDVISRGIKLPNAHRKHKEFPIVADLMAGVGPFAIPLASSSAHCVVHANDLNPHSYKYLSENALLNNCRADRMICYNMDGREFVYTLIRNGITFDHAILNLPSTAISFLDSFIGLGYRIANSSTAMGASGGQQPRIHVYCFSTAEDAGADVVKRAAEVLQCDVAEFGPGPFPLCDNSEVDDITTVHIVRNVAPKKNMICLSFTLPLSVSMREIRLTPESDDEPAGKKLRTE